MLSTVYGDSALKKKQLFLSGLSVSEMVARLQRWCETRTSFTCDGQNIERVQFLVLSDRRMTVGMLADMLSIGKSSVHTILTENLGLRKLCAKIVPKLLTPDQKLRRKECCIDWKNRHKHFHERIIAGDESWFYEYDLELKTQSMERKSKNDPRTKKFRKSRSKTKVLLIFFFLLPWYCSPRIDFLKYKQ